MFPASYDLTWTLVVAVYLVLLGGAVVLLVLAARVLFWLARFLRVATRERELRYELSLVDEASPVGDAPPRHDAPARDDDGPAGTGPEAHPAP